MTLTPSIVLGRELLSLGAALKFTFKGRVGAGNADADTHHINALLHRFAEAGLGPTNGFQLFLVHAVNLSLVQFDCQSFEDGRNRADVALSGALGNAKCCCARRCWRRFLDQRGQRLAGRHHLLPVAAEAADGDRMGLGFLLADDEQGRDLRQYDQARNFCIRRYRFVEQ